MKKKSSATTNGFWDPGFSIFMDELDKEEADRLAPLKAKLKATKDATQKAELKKKIASIKAEFQQKRKDAENSLFLNRGVFDG